MSEWMNHGYEIIEFHTHPYTARQEENICIHRSRMQMDEAQFERDLRSWGVTHACGSLICDDDPKFPAMYGSFYAGMLDENRRVMELARRSNGFIVPGIHVHPAAVRESCDEMERRHAEGVRLIGELVPYRHGWNNYDDPAFGEILGVAAELHMVVSIHTIDHDRMDRMAEAHPNLPIVAAHPGEYDGLIRHIARMKAHPNIYLDLSGTGIFRYGMLRALCDEVGAERILFGSDYPVCSLSCNIGAVLGEPLSEEERRLIFSENARRLLGIR